MSHIHTYKKVKPRVLYSKDHRCNNILSDIEISIN